MNQQDQEDQEDQHFSYAARSIIEAESVMKCVNDAKMFFPFCGSTSRYLKPYKTV